MSWTLVHEMNRSTLVYEMNEMKVTKQVCNIPLLKYIKNEKYFYNICFFEYCKCPIPYVSKIQKNIPEFLDSGRKSWILDSRAWMLDSGCWNLEAGLWTLCSELWRLDSGCWTLVARV